MKSRVLGRFPLPTVALALPLLVLVAGVHAADPGPKAGFRDLKWGDPPAKNMIAGHFQQEGMDVYVRPDGTEKVAGRETAFVSYAFYKNALRKVTIGWPSPATRTNFDAIATDLVAVWGAADHTSPSGERAWVSLDRKTLAILNGSASGDVITLMLGPKPCADAAATAAAGL